jgi:hypothetical protein
MTQAETLKKTVGEFGASAKAKLNEGGQPEDQLRNPLEQFYASAGLSDVGTNQEYRAGHRISTVSENHTGTNVEDIV